MMFKKTEKTTSRDYVAEKANRAMEAIKHRYDFMILYDVMDGNPNGDPNAGGMPRVDIESNHGIVTDACIKHKIRKYVGMVKDGAPGYRLYINNDAPLNRKDISAYDYVGVEDAKTIKDMKKEDPDIDIKIRDFMCENYFDIRTFGAVMTTFTSGALNCGQVCGPVQIGFSRSIDPIMPQEISITRTAITKEKDFGEKKTEMGAKFIVPYALYRCEGHISANIARKVTGFSESDLELLWEAIINMFEHDYSSARGKMVVRELVVFEHDSELGNAPAHKLFDLVKVEVKDNVVTPRSYDDYNVTVDTDSVPNGVTCTRKI